MTDSMISDFGSNNQDDKGVFKSINFAGLAGLFAGILIGCFLALTLAVFSYSFLIETGHAAIIISYMIAYPAILLFFLFIIIELVVYFTGKLILNEKRKLFQRINNLVPASFPGVVFFLTATIWDL